MRILIGYDGGDCSAAILDDLALAGLPPEGEALVMSVAEVWLPPSSYEVAAQTGPGGVVAAKPAYGQEVRLVQQAEALAGEGAEKVRKRLPTWRVKAEVGTGSPAWSLIMAADQWQPDLIFVGSHGRGLLERIALGSVSQKTLTEARCSVRVSRPGGNGGEPPRLLIGHDGSKGAAAAVSAVARRNWPAGAKARIVWAQDSPETLAARLMEPVSGWLANAAKAHRLEAEKRLNEATAILQAAGLMTESAVVDGEPKHLLVEEAAQWKADCVFLGATGAHSRLERFLLGSVANAVASRSRGSVEVVREAWV